MSATDELQRLCAEGGSHTRIKYLRSKIKRSTIAKLRKLLRERGVRFNEFKFMTQWTGAFGESVEAYPTDTFPDTLLVKHVRLTPEQAIAATLGDVTRLPHWWTHDGTLHVELPKLPESISVRLPAQRDREVGSARVWLYTRDSGTCQKVYLVETSDDLIESWHPIGVYLSSKAAGDCAEVLRGEVDGIRQFARVVELKVVDE